MYRCFCESDAKYPLDVCICHAIPTGVESIQPYHKTAKLPKVINKHRALKSTIFWV